MPKSITSIPRASTRRAASFRRTNGYVAWRSRMGETGTRQTVPVTKAQSDSNARSSAAISTCSSRRWA